MPHNAHGEPPFAAPQGWGWEFFESHFDWHNDHWIMRTHWGLVRNGHEHDEHPPNP